MYHNFSLSTYTAEQVLYDFRQRFITDVDADAITLELEEQGIISDGEQMRIRKTDGRKQKNRDLHKCLKNNCTKEALVKVCDVLIDYKGNPKMNALGQEMKRNLHQGRCCVWVSTGDERQVLADEVYLTNSPCEELC